MARAVVRLLRVQLPNVPGRRQVAESSWNGHVHQFVVLAQRLLMPSTRLHITTIFVRAPPALS